MDVLLKKAAEIKNGKATAPTKEKSTAMFTEDDRKKLEAVYHELTHRFDSRVDLDNGKKPPFKDTAIGYALEADKKLELAPGTALGDALNTVVAICKQIRDDIQEIKSK